MKPKAVLLLKDFNVISIDGLNDLIDFKLSEYQEGDDYVINQYDQKHIFYGYIIDENNDFFLLENYFTTEKYLIKKECSKILRELTSVEETLLHQGFNIDIRVLENYNK